eukprot:2848389-Rhodomonas_salina.1
MPRGLCRRARDRRARGRAGGLVAGDARPASSCLGWACLGWAGLVSSLSCLSCLSSVWRVSLVCLSGQVWANRPRVVLTSHALPQKPTALS